MRASPIPRALESTQQTFAGFYPPAFRSPALPTPVITARAIQEETVFPNEGACKRFSLLAAAFAERAALRWNDSPDMQHLNQKLGKYMPAKSPTVAVDGKPRLSGIMDSLNAVLAHRGPDLRLPKEFEEGRTREIIDKIACEEWFGGYKESREYRTLGVGSLASEMVGRMCSAAAGAGSNKYLDAKSPGGDVSPPKFWLAGAHDTTLAGLLTSLGAFGKNPWPPYSSHIAVELFHGPSQASEDNDKASDAPPPQFLPPPAPPTSWLTILPFLRAPQKPQPLVPNPAHPSTSPAHAPTSALPLAYRRVLRAHYVRIRYNDVPVTIPHCRSPGKHLDESRGGDASFCTLEAFREVVEGFAPRDWKRECRTNLDKAGLNDVGREEWAGWPVVGAAGAGMAGVGPFEKDEGVD